jgi:hypothetical protein
VKDDERLQERFQTMMKTPFPSEEALESNFLSHIEAVKTPEVNAEYAKLNSKLQSRKLSEDEMDDFAEAACLTDAFLAEKLGEDAAQFSTRTERVLYFLRKHAHVPGWIVSGAVVVFASTSVASALLRALS